jgi:AAA15 family ATPase/GTPase
MDETLFPNFDEYYDGFNITFELTRVIEMILNEQKTLKFENIELETFKEIFIKTFDDFNEKYQMNYYLSGYSPVQEIRINPNINVYNADNKILVENLLIDFKVNDNWVPWSYLSDGTKRLFYVITQCLSLTDGLLLIEEPELGIHPHQLFSLMEFIKEQSSKKQIIISTHSPIVLDVLSPDELNKINIVKLTKEGTQFYKLNKDQIETAKEYMSKVGDLSYYWLHSDLENE